MEETAMDMVTLGSTGITVNKNGFGAMAVAVPCAVFSFIMISSSEFFINDR